MTMEEYLRANPTEAHKYGKHLIPGAHPECAGCTGDDALRETMRERLTREGREVAQDAADHRVADGMAKAEQERLGAALRREQAARDRALGLGQQTPSSAEQVVAFQGLTVKDGGIYARDRSTFTREEVLTVLKTRKVVLEDRQTAAAELSALLTIFEQME